MMSNFQATTCKPHSRIIVKKPIASLGSTCQYPLYSHALGFHTLQEKVYPRLVLISASHKRLTSVCALSGKGSSGTADDGCVEYMSNDSVTILSKAIFWLVNVNVALFQPLMESLKKAVADAKKPRSIQDLLKEQVAKLREQASGGGRGNGNRRGGSGGSGGPDDESFKETLDEVVQVILATVAFILVYIHIIRGEELYRLARDYTRYLVTGKRTARLKRAMQRWRNFSESFMQKAGSEDDQYERPAVSKPAWWQQPQKFVHFVEDLCRGNWRPHAQES
ncbi:glycine-rich protein [Zea mays]|uniref:Glycine-rich protein n=2 Tax=Zea mays TaxID=4577 RepID=A0A1D6HCL9_MAIZE|nr:glycine-rich protein [Zea mays]